MPEKSQMGKQLNLNDKLAFTRTKLANQRTLLAFIRTSLSFLVVAISLIQFFEIFWIKILAYLFIPLSIIILFFGIWHNRRNNREMKRMELLED